MSDETFHANLELWSHIHPKEAIWLQYLKCENIELIKGEGGVFNLKVRTGEGHQLFYQNGSPQDEARQWAASLDLAGKDLLYVYGVGLGDYYEALKEWLQEDAYRHVVFLEDNLEVIAKLFETEKGTALLSDRQTSLHYFKDVSETEAIFNQLYWNFPMTKPAFGSLRYYERNKGAKYRELCHRIAYDTALKNSLVEEYLQYSIAFYRNYYTNILRINEGYLGNALFGKFNGTPAIICGAGPSLQANISLLKTLQSKAVIFAGSSALNALAAAGLKPHLGAGIDPNPMQEERLKNIPDLDFPFLYRNRLYSGALNLIKGQKLYITGSGGYDTAEWFESRFAIEGKTIEEGRNVVNFCLEIAHEMGCNPILFVGMDLSYTGMKTYASGVVEDSALAGEDIEKALVKRKDIHGKEVYTEWKWISEAKWMGDFASSHPETVLINATEGGIGFPGVPNLTLKKAAAEYLKENYNISEMIQNALKGNSLSHISDGEILTALTELKKGLKQCLSSLEILVQENQKVIAEIQRTNEIVHTQTGLAALTETELADEPAFISVLQVFNEVGTKLLRRDLAKLYDPNNKASEVDKELEKLTLNGEKFAFLINAAKVNISLLDMALKDMHH